MKSAGAVAKTLASRAILSLSLCFLAACGQRGGFEIPDPTAKAQDSEGTPAIYGSCAGLITQEQIDTFLKFNRIKSIAFLTGANPTSCLASDKQPKEIPAFERILITPAHRLLPDYRLAKYEDGGTKVIHMGTKGTIAYLYLLQETVSESDVEELAKVFRVKKDLHKTFKVEIPTWQGVFLGDFPDLKVSQHEEVIKENVKVTSIALALHSTISRKAESALGDYKKGLISVQLFGSTESDSEKLISFTGKAGQSLTGPLLKLVSSSEYLTIAWQRLDSAKNEFIEGEILSPAFEDLFSTTVHLLTKIKNPSDHLKNSLATATLFSEKLWAAEKMSDLVSTKIYFEALDLLTLDKSHRANRIKEILTLISPYYTHHDDKDLIAFCLLRVNRLGISSSQIQQANFAFERLKKLKPSRPFFFPDYLISPKLGPTNWKEAFYLVESLEFDEKKIEEMVSLLEEADKKDIRISISSLSGIDNKPSIDFLRRRIDQVHRFREEFDKDLSYTGHYLEMRVFDTDNSDEKIFIYLESLKFISKCVLHERPIQFANKHIFEKGMDLESFKAFAVLYRWLVFNKKLFPGTAETQALSFVNSPKFTVEMRSRTNELFKQLAAPDLNQVVEVNRFFEKIYGNDSDVIEGKK